MFREKITRAKLENICRQSTIATLMKPFHYDSRLSAAKDNGNAQIAAAVRNLDAAILQHHVANCMHLLTWQHTDLQSQISNTLSKHPHMNKRTLQNSEEEPIRVRNGPSGNRLALEVSLSPAAATLPQKRDVSCSSVLLKADATQGLCSQ